jgi:hypothetical protein
VKLPTVLTVCMLVIGTNLWSQQDTIIYNPHIDSLMAQVSDDSIYKHVLDLAHADGYFSRVSYTPGNEWSANYIKQAFEKFPGLTSVFFDTFFVFNAPPPYNTIPLVNVVAVLEGSQDPSQEYIVGGHFDATARNDPSYNWDVDWPTAIAPGADDNATGIASMLEIARILSDSSNGFNNDYTIKFVAFGAEEVHPAYNNEHHWGSRSYVIKAYSNNDDIRGVYILDMIGFNDTGNNYYNIVSDNQSRDLGRKMLEVNQTYQIGLATNSEPFPEETYSDHDQFWIYGYDAILVIENAPPWVNNPPWYNLNPYYHKQTDTPDRVNIPQVRKIAQNSLGVVAHLSSNITSIGPDRISGNIPQNFSLHQNYPNPFNPTTTIEFEIQKAGHARLEIVNLQGQVVGTVVDKEMMPGTYKTTFDGERLTSGLYFYRLTTKNFSSTRKMVLMK